MTWHKLLETHHYSVLTDKTKDIRKLDRYYLPMHAVYKVQLIV